MFSKLSKPRIDYIENIMKAPGNVRLNLDFWPSSYYYATVFWASHFRDSSLTKILSGVEDTTIWTLLAVLFVIAVIYAFFGRRVTGGGPYRGLGLAVAAAGFTGMALQVIILIAFQMIYGYLFYKLGIILTAFMFGLSLGAWWITVRSPDIRDGKVIFIFLQLCLALYPATFPIALNFLASGQGDMIRWLGSNIIFLAMPAIAGFVGGVQFPLANKILLESGIDRARSAGYTYGLDLIGASIGSAVAGSILVPLIGIVQACLAVSLLNGMVLFILVMNEREASVR